MDIRQQIFSFTGKIATENGLLRANVAKWDGQTGSHIEDLFDYRMETHYEFNPLVYYVYPVISFDSSFNRSAFSLNSRTVTLSSNSDIASVLFTEYGTVQNILWSPDDSHLVVTSGTEDTYEIQTFDIATGDLINSIHGPDYHAYDVVWSSDNSHIAVTSIWANPFNPSANVRVYSIRKGKDYFTDGDMNFGFDLIQKSINQTTIIPIIVWYPKNNILAIFYSPYINFYKVPNKESVATIQAQNIVLLDWSPDGKYLVGSEEDGQIHIWDAPDLGQT